MLRVITSLITSSILLEIPCSACSHAQCPRAHCDCIATSSATSEFHHGLKVIFLKGHCGESCLSWVPLLLCPLDCDVGPLDFPCCQLEDPLPRRHERTPKSSQVPRWSAATFSSDLRFVFLLLSLHFLVLSQLCEINEPFRYGDVLYH
jgi:hypothetical protein